MIEPFKDTTPRGGPTPRRFFVLAGRRNLGAPPPFFKRRSTLVMRGRLYASACCSVSAGRSQFSSPPMICSRTRRVLSSICPLAYALVITDTAPEVLASGAVPFFGGPVKYFWRGFWRGAPDPSFGRPPTILFFWICCA